MPQPPSNKLRLYVTHRGFSYPLVAWMRNEERIVAIALDNESDGRDLVQPPRVLRDTSTEVFLADRDQRWREGRAEVAAKCELLTDLLHTGLEWRALVTCKNSPSLFGIIISATEARRIGATRPWRRPQSEIPASLPSPKTGTLGAPEPDPH